MNYIFDRGIMRWFDHLFEKHTNTFLIDNFICNMYDRARPVDKSDILPLATKKYKDDSVISLAKKESSFWTISFLLSSKYVYELRENVHPYFGHYIYENISVYNNDDVYSFVNKYLLDILNYMVDYIYYPEEDDYYIDYRDEFINTCSDMDYGERVLVTEDIYMFIISEDQLNFIDKSERFNLELRFDSRGGQELMDAILDLSRSILLKTR